MKRLILSGLLFVIVVTISLFGLFYINKNYEEITKSISLCEECVTSGDLEAAEKHIKEAEKIYIKAEKYLSAFVNHSTLDDIGVSISAIEPLVSKGEEPTLLSRCREAKTALKHLKNDMAISIRNLF